MEVDPRTEHQTLENHTANAAELGAFFRRGSNHLVELSLVLEDRDTLNALDPHMPEVSRGVQLKCFDTDLNEDVSCLSEDEVSYRKAARRLGNIERLEYGDVPLICVVAPALDEEEALPTFLESIKRQRTDFPVSVVIADNGSEDATASIALENGANVVVCAQRGIGPARSAGVRHALEGFQYPHNQLIIVQVDTDEVLDPTYIQSVGEGFMTDQDMMVSVGPTVYTLSSNEATQVIQTGRDFRNTFQTHELQDLFTDHGRDIGDYVITPRCRMLIGGNTAYRATLFSEHGITYPDGNAWESVVMSVKIQQIVSSSSIAYLPGQRLTTSDRAYANAEGVTPPDSLSRIHELGYIPPFKAPDAKTPHATVRELISQIDRETYSLREGEHIVAVGTMEDVENAKRQAPALSRIIPARHAATGKPLQDKYALIIEQ